jgi:hypothetical protein
MQFILPLSSRIYRLEPYADPLSEPQNSATFINPLILLWKQRILRFAIAEFLLVILFPEFTVPVSRVHHRELHRSGDEAA